MSPRARLSALAPLAALVLAGCDDPRPATGTTSSAPAPQPSAVASAPATITTSSTSAPSAPTASASALPSSDPSSMHTAPSAAPSAKPQASATAAPPKPRPAPSAVADAGAGVVDAGAAASGDAGAPNQALSFAQKVDAIFAKKKTFSARFKQQYTLFTTGQPKESTGTVMIERPSKLSFRYDPPRKDRVVSDGVTIKIYQAEEQQMIELPAQKTEYPGAFAFMLGKGISTSFDFAINPKANWASGVVLDGRPLTPNPSYDLVMFYVDTAALQASEPGAVKRVLVIDAQKNRNRFDFENVTQPDSIDPAEFTFTPPPGTTIKK